MNDVPISEETNHGVSCRSVAELLRNDPQLMYRAMDGFFEMYRDELLQLAARELVNRLLQDHHRELPNLFFEDLLEVTADKFEEHQDDFLAVIAKELGHRFFPNPCPDKDPFVHMYNDLVRKMEEKVAEASQLFPAS